MPGVGVAAEREEEGGERGTAEEVEVMGMAEVAEG